MVADFITRRRSAVALRNLVIASLFCSGCASSLPTPSAITKYADLEASVGRDVVLAGYWSAQHEATGIYFGNRDYRDAPKHCVETHPTIQVGHSEAVRVSGTLERSGCGHDLICLTVCQPYVLRNAHVVR